MHADSGVIAAEPSRPMAKMAAIIGIAFIWVLLVPRLIPDPRGLDNGVYVSVADRLRAGDRLYVDVWDDKEPLFHYVGALSRVLSPFGLVATVVVWLLLAGCAVYVIAKRCHLPSIKSAFLAFGLTPIVLTLPQFVAGSSHLGGIAICLCALAARYSSRYVLAGVLAGFLFFFKLVLFPVLLVCLVLTATRKTHPSNWARLSLGFALSFLGIVTVLLVRGELVGYFNLLYENAFEYAPSLVDRRWGPFVGHLLRVFSGVSAATLVLLLLLILFGFLASRRARDDSEWLEVTWRCGIGSSGAALAVLAVTGMWDHHAQILNIPIILLVIVAASSVPELVVIGTSCSILAAIVAIANVHNPRADRLVYEYSLDSGRDALRALQAQSIETRLIVESGVPGTYARVGSIGDEGHAFGLAGWTLACPRFYQQEFFSTERLELIAQCLRGVDTILVEKARLTPNGELGWDDFVSRVRSVIDDGYACKPSGEYLVCREIGS